VSGTSRRRSLEPFIATRGHATLKTDKSELYAARADFSLAHDSPGRSSPGGPRAVAHGRICKSNPLKAAPISAALNDRGALTSRGGHGTTARNPLVRAGFIRPFPQIARSRLAEDHTRFTRDTRGVCCAD
jgi:hypothetical protein